MSELRRTSIFDRDSRGVSPEQPQTLRRTSIFDPNTREERLRDQSMLQDNALTRGFKSTMASEELGSTRMDLAKSLAAGETDDAPALLGRIQQQEEQQRALAPTGPAALSEFLEDPSLEGFGHLAGHTIGATAASILKPAAAATAARVLTPKRLKDIASAVGAAGGSYDMQANMIANEVLADPAFASMELDDQIQLVRETAGGGALLEAVLPFLVARRLSGGASRARSSSEAVAPPSVGRSAAGSAGIEFLTELGQGEIEHLSLSRFDPTRERTAMDRLDDAFAGALGGGAIGGGGTAAMRAGSGAVTLAEKGADAVQQRLAERQARKDEAGRAKAQGREEQLQAEKDAPVEHGAIYNAIDKFATVANDAMDKTAALPIVRRIFAGEPIPSYTIDSPSAYNRTKASIEAAAVKAGEISGDVKAQIKVLVDAGKAQSAEVGALIKQGKQEVHEATQRLADQVRKMPDVAADVRQKAEDYLKGAVTRANQIDIATAFENAVKKTRVQEIADKLKGAIGGDLTKHSKIGATSNAVMRPHLSIAFARADQASVQNLHDIVSGFARQPAESGTTQANMRMLRALLSDAVSDPVAMAKDYKQFLTGIDVDRSVLDVVIESMASNDIPRVKNALRNSTLTAFADKHAVEIAQAIDSAHNQKALDEVMAQYPDRMADAIQGLWDYQNERARAIFEAEGAMPVDESAADTEVDAAEQTVQLDDTESDVASKQMETEDTAVEAPDSDIRVDDDGEVTTAESGDVGMSLTENRPTSAKEIKTYFEKGLMNQPYFIGDSTRLQERIAGRPEAFAMSMREYVDKYLDTPTFHARRIMESVFKRLDSAYTKDRATQIKRVEQKLETNKTAMDLIDPQQNNAKELRALGVKSRAELQAELDEVKNKKDLEDRSGSIARLNRELDLMTRAMGFDPRVFNDRLDIPGESLVSVLDNYMVGVDLRDNTEAASDVEMRSYSKLLRRIPGRQNDPNGAKALAIKSTKFKAVLEKDDGTEQVVPLSAESMAQKVRQSSEHTDKSQPDKAQLMSAFGDALARIMVRPDFVRFEGLDSRLTINRNPEIKYQDRASVPGVDTTQNAARIVAEERRQRVMDRERDEAQRRDALDDDIKAAAVRDASSYADARRGVLRQMLDSTGDIFFAKELAIDAVQGTAMPQQRKNLMIRKIRESNDLAVDKIGEINKAVAAQIKDIAKALSYDPPVNESFARTKAWIDDAIRQRRHRDTGTLGVPERTRIKKGMSYLDAVKHFFVGFQKHSEKTRFWITKEQYRVIYSHTQKALDVEYPMPKFDVFEDMQLVEDRAGSKTKSEPVVSAKAKTRTSPYPGTSRGAAAVRSATKKAAKDKAAERSTETQEATTSVPKQTVTTVSETERFARAGEAQIQHLRMRIATLAARRKAVKGWYPLMEQHIAEQEADARAELEQRGEKPRTYDENTGISLKRGFTPLERNPAIQERSAREQVNTPDLALSDLLERRARLSKTETPERTNRLLDKKNMKRLDMNVAIHIGNRFAEVLQGKRKHTLSQNQGIEFAPMYQQGDMSGRQFFADVMLDEMAMRQAFETMPLAALRTSIETGSTGVPFLGGVPRHYLNLAKEVYRLRAHNRRDSTVNTVLGKVMAMVQDGKAIENGNTITLNVDAGFKVPILSVQRADGSYTTIVNTPVIEADIGTWKLASGTPARRLLLKKAGITREWMGRNINDVQTYAKFLKSIEDGKQDDLKGDITGDGRHLLLNSRFIDRVKNLIPSFKPKEMTFEQIQEFASAMGKALGDRDTADAGWSDVWVNKQIYDGKVTNARAKKAEAFKEATTKIVYRGDRLDNESHLPSAAAQFQADSMLAFVKGRGEGLTLGEVLAEAANVSNRKDIGKFISHLLKVKGDVLNTIPFKLGTSNQANIPRQVSGVARYDFGSQEIHFVSLTYHEGAGKEWASGNSDFISVLIHETSHALTIRAEAMDVSIANEMGRLYKAAFSHLAVAKKINEYGLTSTQEMLAEAFSNPTFRRLLHGIPDPAAATKEAPRLTWWESAMNVLGNILGMRDPREQSPETATLLESLFAVGAEAMKSAKATTKAGVLPKSVSTDQFSKIRKMKPGRPRKDQPETVLKQVAAEVARLRGRDVTVLVNRMAELGGAGRYRREGAVQDKTTMRIIEIAYNILDPMGAARHESMHDFLAELKRHSPEHKRVIEALEMTATRLRPKMEKILTEMGEKEAAKQLSDPEERVAFMYQLWDSGHLNIRQDSTTTAFMAIKALIMNLFGLLTDADRAAILVERFHSGDMNTMNWENRMRAVNPLLMERRWESGWQMYENAVGKHFTVTDERLRDMGFPQLTEIADLFAYRIGGEQEAMPLLQARAQEEGKWTNKLNKMVDKYGELTMQDAWSAMQLKKPIRTDAQRDLRKLLDDMYYYQRGAGVEVMSQVEVLSKEGIKVSGQLKADINAARGLKKKVGRAEIKKEALTDAENRQLALLRGFDSLFEQNEMDLSAIDGFVSKYGLNMADVHISPDMVKKRPRWTPIQKREGYAPQVWDIIQIAKNKEGFAQALYEESQHAHPTKRMRTPTEAMRVVDAIIQGNGITEIAEINHHVNFVPMSDAASHRYIDFINEGNAARFAPFMSKDVVGSMQNYLGQMTHRAEFSRRFGGHGQVITEKLADAVMKGMQPKQLKEAERHIQALLGVLGHDLDPRLKLANTAIVSVNNFMLLPLAVFSQFVDPLGIAIRTGKMNDAWTAYKDAYKEAVHHISGNKREYSDERGRQMAEYMGIVQRETVMMAMGHVQGSMLMHPTLAKWNKAFFKYNLMQPFNDVNRVAATKAGELYLRDVKNDPEKLAEVGLKKDDLVFTVDGQQLLWHRDQIAEAKPGWSEAKVEAAEKKIHQAMFRFVDQAVIRPNAAQRPTWMSDPRFMIVAHLKQWAFSFQKVILERVKFNVNRGDSKSAYLLAAYLPFIMAADMAKWVIFPGYGLDRITQMGFSDYFTHSLDRSGIMGVRGFGADVLDDSSRGRALFHSFLGPTYEMFTMLSQYLTGDTVSTERVMKRMIPGYRAMVQ